MILKLILAFAIAMAVSAVAGKYLVPYLRAIKAGQSIREDGPVWHMSKQGTPTMGGLMIGASVLVTSLIMHPAGWYGMNDFMLALVAVSILSMLVGFADDFIKVAKKTLAGPDPLAEDCRSGADRRGLLHLLLSASDGRSVHSDSLLQC